jgi:hypothetical protein
MEMLTRSVNAMRQPTKLNATSLRFSGQARGERPRSDDLSGELLITLLNLNQVLDLREPSVHEEFSSIHETAVTRRQEQHRLCDFLWLADATHRHQA